MHDSTALDSAAWNVGWHAFKAANPSRCRQSAAYYRRLRTDLRADQHNAGTERERIEIAGIIASLDEHVSVQEIR